MKIEEILKPKVIAEILGITVSTVYCKLKLYQGNKFSESDLEKIKETIKRLI